MAYFQISTKSLKRASSNNFIVKFYNIDEKRIGAIITELFDKFKKFVVDERNGSLLIKSMSLDGLKSIL